MPPSPDNPGGQDDSGEDSTTVDSGDYDNLTDAIAATPDGGTLVLSDNVDLEDSLFLDRDITIDLNGNTING